jgi:hypothetical protein
MVLNRKNKRIHKSYVAVVKDSGCLSGANKTSLGIFQRRPQFSSSLPQREPIFNRIEWTKVSLQGSPSLSPSSVPPRLQRMKNMHWQCNSGGLNSQISKEGKAIVIQWVSLGPAQFAPRIALRTVIPRSFVNLARATATFWPTSKPNGRRWEGRFISNGLSLVTLYHLMSCLTTKIYLICSWLITYPTKNPVSFHLPLRILCCVLACSQQTLRRHSSKLWKCPRSIQGALFLLVKLLQVLRIIVLIRVPLLLEGFAH